jgi:hypothetical protein
VNEFIGIASYVSSCLKVKILICIFAFQICNEHYHFKFLKIWWLFIFLNMLLLLFFFLFKHGIDIERRSLVVWVVRTFACSMPRGMTFVVDIRAPWCCLTMRKNVFCNWPCNSKIELQKTFATHCIYMLWMLMNKLHEL